MSIYYSEFTLLLESFIVLFKLIYKNIYLTITKLDILKYRNILFYALFCNLVIHRKFVVNFSALKMLETTEMFLNEKLNSQV